MSDRSYFQLVIHDALAEELAAFRAALDKDTPYGDDWTAAAALGDLVGTNEAPDEGDALPLRWGWDECQLDAATTYGPLIAAAMPGASFECWVDPKYEYSGELFMHVPELGSWSGMCDAEGEPYAPLYAIAEAIKPDTLAARQANLDALVGQKWYERLHPLCAALDARPAELAAIAADLDAGLIDPATAQERGL